MNDIVIYPSKLKMLGLAVLVGLFIGVMILMLSTPKSLPLWAVMFFSCIGLPFFGLCFIYIIYRLFSPKPSLVVNREGIIDNASAIGVGLLRWEEIQQIIPHDYMNQRMLGIILVDREAIIKRQPPWKQLLMRANTHLIVATVNIPQNTLPVTVDELALQIQAYQAHLQHDRFHPLVEETYPTDSAPHTAKTADFLYQLKKNKAVEYLLFAVVVFSAIIHFVKISDLQEAHVPPDAMLGGSPGSVGLFLIFAISIPVGCLIPLFPWCAVRALFLREKGNLHRTRWITSGYLLAVVLLSVLSVCWSHYYFYLNNQGIHLHPFAAGREVHYRWEQVHCIHTHIGSNTTRSGRHYDPEFILEMEDGRRIDILSRIPVFFAAYPSIEENLFRARPNLPVLNECDEKTLWGMLREYPKEQAAQMRHILTTGHPLPQSQP